MIPELLLDSHSPEETIQFAAHWCAALPSGTLLALSGGLGAGKTTFTRGALQGFGHHAAVTSPTFTYLHLYPTPMGTIAHFDLYRIQRPDEFVRMGWDEVCEQSRLTLMEWPERLQDQLPAHAWKLQFLADGDHRQLLLIRPKSPPEGPHHV